jgi:hypothetical protein
MANESGKDQRRWERFRRRALREAQLDAEALAGVLRREEAHRMVEHLASQIPGPGRPRVRDMEKLFSDYAGSTDGEQPRCRRPGCRRHLRRDQALACSPHCADELIKAALFNLSRLREEVEHRATAAADEIERRALLEQSEQEAFVAEHLAAYERGL